MILEFVRTFGIVSTIFARCLGNPYNHNVGNDLFTSPDSVPSLNGFVCTGSFTIRDNLYTESVSQCARFCSAYWECVGFFYRPDSTKCIMCNYLFQPAGTTSLQTMSGSKYFERSECHGWISLLGAKKLQIFFQKVNRSEAQSICEANNGTLVKITEAWQMERLSDILTSCASYIGNDYWTDGVLDTSTGTYLFSDGTAVPMDATDFWEPGAPDNGDLCIRLRYNSAINYFRWNDYYCGMSYRFICEY